MDWLMGFDLEKPKVKLKDLQMDSQKDFDSVIYSDSSKPMD
jgi:hypothetical protein